jgi:hypothetical protein
MRPLSTLLSVAGFAVAAFAATTSANAAPLGAAKYAVGDTAGQVQSVDYRSGYRHCHWKHGRKWCHGGVSRYDGYRRPGVYLRFGFGGDRDRHYKRRYWR